nr:MAG TPA: antimicrobial protein [Caudoviricetes sp.]
MLLLYIIGIIHITYCFFIKWEILRCPNSTKCRIYK